MSSGQTTLAHFFITRLRARAGFESVKVFLIVRAIKRAFVRVRPGGAIGVTPLVLPQSLDLRASGNSRIVALAEFRRLSRHGERTQRFWEEFEDTNKSDYATETTSDDVYMVPFAAGPQQRWETNEARQTSQGQLGTCGDVFTKIAAIFAASPEKLSSRRAFFLFYRQESKLLLSLWRLRQAILSRLTY